MRLGYKLTGIFLIFTLSITIFFYVSGLLTQKHDFRLIALEHINNIKTSFDNLEERDSKILFSTLEVLVQDPGLKKAYLEMNRGDLYDYGQQLFQNLRSKYGITHFYFIQPDGRVYLRMHNKYIYGDMVERISFLKARDTKKQAWEIELGKTAFALRAVMPYYKDDELIGYLELGEEIDHFLEILKGETDSEFGMFADKKHMNRDDWGSTRQVAGLRDDWDDMDDHLVISSTVEGAVAERCFVESSLEKAEEGESIFRQFRRKDRIFMCGGFELNETGGRHIGAVLSLTDITRNVAVAQKANDAILRMSLILFFVIFTAGILISRSITRPILKLAEVARAIGRGDLDQRVSVTSTDEIGEMGTTFNDMIEKRIRAEKELQKAHDELEIRVKERTTELTDLNVQYQQEITERKRAEEELMTQHKFVRDTIESLTHPFYVIDANDYTIKMANKAANLGSLSGSVTCHKLTHRSDTPCDSGEHPCPVEEVKRTKEPTMVEHVHYDVEGNKKTYEIYGYPIFDNERNVVQIIEYNMDITERKKHEEELLRARNLETIGQLAVGIAHEINNPLTNASLGMQILKNRVMKVSSDTKISQKLESIEMSVERASVIAKELLQFSRQKESEFAPLYINDLISGALTLMEFKFSNVTVHKYLKDLPEIIGDQVKLEQVLLNVLNNSVESMTDGGKISLSTSLVEGEVTVEITDTGIGISEKHISKVFEPFFRKKQVGSGTGLGLSICYSIIKQHNGNIEISSREGKGTTVTIKLPVKEDHG